MIPWVADAELLARLVPLYGEVQPMNTHSSDVSDAFLSNLIGDCHPGRLDCDPAVFVGCWLSESGLSPRAQNKEALASGFFQAMPAILRGMGFKGDVQYTEPPGAFVEAKRENDKARMRALDQALADAFCRLSLEVQLVWAYRYYRPHSGKLVNPGACYAANFVPAWIEHASTPTWIICAKDGRSDGGLTPERSEEWFRENAGLDVDGDGAITMGDLAAKAERSAATPRGQELLARLNALRADQLPEETQPDLSAEIAELQALAAEPPPLDDAS